MVKIRSLPAPLFFVALGSLTIGCSAKDSTPNLAEATPLGMSVRVAAPQGASNQVVSPASVTVRVPDVDGTGGTLVAVEATFRDASGRALAEGRWATGVAIPPNGVGQATLELRWQPPNQAARYLDLSVSVRDSAGAIHVQTLALVAGHSGEWIAG